MSWRDRFRKMRSMLVSKDDCEGALNMFLLFTAVCSLPLLSKLAHTQSTHHNCVTKEQSWKDLQNEYNNWLNNHWNNWINWHDWSEWCDWSNWGNGH